jgi:hypothetical protein
MWKIRIPKRENTAAILFFGIYLFIGLLIYRDYGISWDEPPQRTIGVLNVQYILGLNQDLLGYFDRFYGPVFEIFLSGMERLVRPAITRDVYLLRHLLTFLTFYLGCIFFYFLSKNFIKKRWMALLCSAALILSPRIFEHSFYNSKDIPSLVAFIIGFTLLFWYIDLRRSWLLIFLALVSAVAITIRLSGLLIPCLTLIAIFLEYFQPTRKIATISAKLLVFSAAVVLLIILFWPILWSNPPGNFIGALQAMSKFSWPANVLFMGQRYFANEIPPWYLIVWITITTPVLYLLLFGVGLILGFAETTPLKKAFISTWFFFPLILVIVLKSVVYDSWRHLYFIYPALLLLAFYGLQGLLIRLNRRFGQQNAYAVVLLLTVAVSFTSTTLFMIRNHPYQQLYFNFLVGNHLGDVAGRYDTDYWGLAYREGLEYISQIDSDPQIPYAFETRPGSYNFVLPEADAKRLQPVTDRSQAKYYLTQFRWETTAPYDQEIFSVRRDGLKILSVYKIR